MTTRELAACSGHVWYQELLYDWRGLDSEVWLGRSANLLRALAEAKQKPLQLADVRQESIGASSSTSLRVRSPIEMLSHQSDAMSMH